MLPEPVAYWSVRESAQAGAVRRFAGSFAAATDQLEQLLRQSIAGQMVADVPVGAFLSGGIDSSTVVALMQAQSTRRVKTFSIGFHESEYNEAQYAGAIASHLGTDHTELYVTAAEAQAVIPRLPAIYDEPFADSSQIPTFLVAQLARQYVTVSLSGDGGDELFAGYTRYAATHSLWRATRMLPVVLRRALAAVVQQMPAVALDAPLFWLAPLLARRGAPARVSSKLYRLAELLEQTSLAGLYRAMISYHWPGGGGLLPRTGAPLSAPADWAGLDDARERMMCADQTMYLPDDILVKVDRAGMAVSLETRMPLLDHRLVEFAWQLPIGYKVQGGRSKAVLRSPGQVYSTDADRSAQNGLRRAAGALAQRTAAGLGRRFARARALAADGLIDEMLIRRMWQEHLSGQREWQHQLWAVLMFQAWRQNRSSQTLAEAA